ncbi:lysophospholipase [Algoriphagus lutimaris]|uniref:GDSL-type esterase/lipase family protein n=1 Tax=Algoriphagus lutimaris TaxID=613197 RepID=UPI00196B368A|nr:GDSL-type esterase/lipase family protein [Algoriphagus lutimaris]MBN3518796.1 lysophospholipase [Algoriphagus lutimaris]
MLKKRPFFKFFSFSPLLILILSFTIQQKENSYPKTLHFIGDSSIRMGGESNLQIGWSNFLQEFFDSTRLKVSNQAMAGRSTRASIKERRWNKELSTLQPGDYVIMQSGHNDSSPIDDTLKAEGVVQSAGQEVENIYIPITKQQEPVYSYSQYLRQMIFAAKTKEVTPLVCSLIPRNNWKNGKVIRADKGYGLWAKQIAQDTFTTFIDLNTKMANQYDGLGEDYVRVHYFDETDHTPTILEGAELNANIVAKAIDNLAEIGLKEYIMKYKLLENLSKV